MPEKPIKLSRITGMLSRLTAGKPPAKSNTTTRMATANMSMYTNS